MKTAIVFRNLYKGKIVMLNGREYRMKNKVLLTDNRRRKIDVNEFINLCESVSGPDLFDVICRDPMIDEGRK